MSISIILVWKLWVCFEHRRQRSRSLPSRTSPWALGSPQSYTVLWSHGFYDPYCCWKPTLMSMILAAIRDHFCGMCCQNQCWCSWHMFLERIHVDVHVRTIHAFGGCYAQGGSSARVSMLAISMRMRYIEGFCANLSLPPPHKKKKQCSHENV